MTNIVIIGGGVEGLILSILSAENHNVTLIDIHPEIGFPCTVPGWVENIETLQKYLNDEEIKQLNPLQNTNNISISGEWLFKILTIKAVQAGVDILLRCRVTNIDQSGPQPSIHFLGGNNSGNGNILCNKFFDLTKFSAAAPGQLKHNITTTSKQPIVPTFDHWGGIALSKECQNNPSNPILQLTRSGGLCELWYDNKPTWTPTSGWIEIMKNTTPKPIKEMSIDASIARGESIFHSMNPK
ncbi:MAG: hypothetical protein NZ736_02010 [Candidatus Poseidoniaceae archaeon]|nr:hypothetical protein [Candidatus Poseidoniaceae archaeon]